MSAAAFDTLTTRPRPRSGRGRAPPAPKRTPKPCAGPSAPTVTRRSPNTWIPAFAGMTKAGGAGMTEAGGTLWPASGMAAAHSGSTDVTTGRTVPLTPTDEVLSFGGGSVPAKTL